MPYCSLMSDKISYRQALGRQARSTVHFWVHSTTRFRGMRPAPAQKFVQAAALPQSVTYRWFKRPDQLLDPIALPRSRQLGGRTVRRRVIVQPVFRPIDLGISCRAAAERAVSGRGTGCTGSGCGLSAATLMVLSETNKNNVPETVLPAILRSALAVLGSSPRQVNHDYPQPRTQGSHQKIVRPRT